MFKKIIVMIFIFSTILVAKYEKSHINSIGVEFVLIPAGFYKKNKTEKMFIKKPFYISKYEITQMQWDKVMDEFPSKNVVKYIQKPVENVDWYDVKDFIKELNELEQTKRYRLPREKEWEYIIVTYQRTLENRESLKKSAWFWDNGAYRTQIIGTKKPNALGMYDMLGNVFEWCEDWYQKSGILKEHNTTKEIKKRYKVIRGGSFKTTYDEMNTTKRFFENPSTNRSDIGFRLVIELD